MTSSPPTADFATAGSFNIHNDQILNSTMNMGDLSTQQQLPLDYNDHPTQQSMEYGSEGSADMSIEIGRGGKRRAEHDLDVSSNMVFNFGSDGQYEVTGTPPARPRATSRKSDGALRREAAVRNATNSAKAGTKHRSLSEQLSRMSVDDPSQQTATLNNSRNTRFTRSRQPSAIMELSPPSRFTAPASTTPRRSAVNNPTVQSANYTANSFMLPDLPNITELVSGTRKDGTPVFNRNNRSRSRFTSATYHQLRTEHATIENVPIPDEEKAVYASLQLLQDKVAQLETSKAEVECRAQGWESEVIELRAQLESERRHSPDSGLGSDEDDETAALDAFRNDKTRMRARVKSLEDKLNRSERKANVAEIQADRIRKERDELITQIGVAYYNNEELKADNEMLKEELEAMKRELSGLKDQQQTRPKRRSSSKRAASAPLEADVSGDEPTAPRERFPHGRKGNSQRKQATEEDTPEEEEDLASRIAKSVQKHRDEASVPRRRSAEQKQDKPRRREASTGAERPLSVPKRTAPAPKPTPAARPVSAPLVHDVTETTRRSLQLGEDGDLDVTQLSEVDTQEISNMRRKLEIEMRERHQREREELLRSAEQPLPRKSSLKDISAGLGNVTGRGSLPGEDAEPTKTGKSVRVQSPQPSELQQDEEADVGETSILSNTSRRRRRVSANSEAGMTSAFILPDITMHSSQPFPTTTGQTKGACIAHSAASCTACHPFDFDLTIPTPVPVTDRQVPQDPDITSATIRPAQEPATALATVIKQKEDELRHWKMVLEQRQREYSQHDPAMSMRKRVRTRADIERLLRDIEIKSNQIYALYDVLEGQKQAAAAEKAKSAGYAPNNDEEDTMSSVSVEQGRGSGSGMPYGLDGAYEDEESEELPWEGLSDVE